MTDGLIFGSMTACQEFNLVVVDHRINVTRIFGSGVSPAYYKLMGFVRNLDADSGGRVKDVLMDAAFREWVSLWIQR